MLKLREATSVEKAEYGGAVRCANASHFKFRHQVATRRETTRGRIAVGKLKEVGNTTLGQARDNFGGVLGCGHYVDDDAQS